MFNSVHRDIMWPALLSESDISVFSIHVFIEIFIVEKR